MNITQVEHKELLEAVKTSRIAKRLLEASKLDKNTIIVLCETNSHVTPFVSWFYNRDSKFFLGRYFTELRTAKRTYKQRILNNQ